MAAATPNSFVTFCKKFSSENYPANQVVLRADEQVTHFYFVESGAVKMMTTAATGQDLVLHVFYPDSCFSLLTLVQEDRNTYDFVTLTPTQLRKIPKSALINFLQKNPTALFELQLRLLRGLQGLLNRLAHKSFSATYQQVASLLLYFAKHFGESTQDSANSGTAIQLRVTHQEIANWLGISRENVSIQLKELERAGVIQQQHRHFVVRKLDQLQHIADFNSLS